MLKITGADVVVAVYSVRPFHRATFDTVAWQTPTITFDTVLYVRCAPPPAVTFWGCTTSFMSPLSRIIREKFPLPTPLFCPQNRLAKYISYRRTTDIFGIYSLNAIERTNKPDKSLSTLDIDKLRLQTICQLLWLFLALRAFDLLSNILYKEFRWTVFPLCKKWFRMAHIPRAKLPVVPRYCLCIIFIKRVNVIYL